jgi:UDP-N-acetylmuramyl pentapeptide phosphotransferase/UDP-N-acetylglucosamine-1-phosphate transferase
MTMAGLFYLSSFLLGALGAWLIFLSAKKLGLLDHPNERSSHSNPTPKAGGIGILVAFISGALWWHIPLSLWIPACILSLVSLLGDYRDVSFKTRLSTQLGLAAIVSGSIYMRGSLSYMPLGLTILLIMFGTLFIAATANYYNFMDGINGIAGLTGAIAFLCLGIFALFQGKDLPWIPAAFGVAAACLGFLPLNFPRAKVFMGDVGSVLLGFLFASFVLWCAQSLLEFVVLTSFLFPFYVDEFNTQLVRIKERERLTNAHRRHIYQILVNQAGLSHGIVTAIYGFIQIMVAILAWIVMRVGFLAVVGLLIGFFVLFFFGGMHIRQRWEGNKEMGLNGARLI